jgi:hypothetical protein
MGLFDKIKKGVSGAGTKAKVTVDINRLKLQINSKRRDIDNKYKLMGEAYFHANMHGNTEGLEALLQGYCEDVINHQKQINELQVKIKEMGNEKECSCGRTVELAAKYCPTCGHQFDGTEQIIVLDEPPEQR